MTSIIQSFLQISRETYPLCRIEEVKVESVRTSMKFLSDLARSQMTSSKEPSSLHENEQREVYRYLTLFLYHHEVRVLHEVQKLFPKLFSSLDFTNDTVLGDYEQLIAATIELVEGHRTRKDQTRRAKLGSVEEISLDSIDGYERFENYLFLLLLFFYHVVQCKISRLFTLFFQQTIDNVDILSFVFERLVPHENRYINEQVCYVLHLLAYPTARKSMALSTDPVDSSQTNMLKSAYSGRSEQYYHEYNFYSYLHFLALSCPYPASSPSSPSSLPCVILDHLNELMDLTHNSHFKPFLAFHFVRIVCCGLQDSFPQVRLAASKACLHLLSYLQPDLQLTFHENNVKHKDISIKADEKDWESVFLVEEFDPHLPYGQERGERKGEGEGVDSGVSLRSLLADECAAQSPYLLPRIVLNCYYPADSIQSLSRTMRERHLSAEAFSLCLLTHLSQAVGYYVMCTQHNNHNIVEAACVALTELFVRHKEGIEISMKDSDDHALFDLQRLVEGVLGVFHKCLCDSRWPVLDSALLTSAQIIFKYQTLFPGPLLSPAITGLIIQCYLSSLLHNIIAIRTHSLQALSLLLSIPCWREEISSSLDEHLGSNLLKACVFTNPAGSSLTSFLPPAMLEKYKAGKGKAREDIATVSDSARITKGWDCCIDCQDMRIITPPQISGSILKICSELAQKLPDVYTEKREVVIENDELYRKYSSIYPSAVPRYGRLCMTVLEAMLLLLDEENKYSGYDSTQEVVYLELPGIVSYCVKEAKNHQVANFVSQLVTILVRDVKKVQEETSKLAPSANVKRVVYTASNALAPVSKTTGATTATIRKARNAESSGKNYILHIAREIRSVLNGNYDESSKLLADLATLSL